MAAFSTLVAGDRDDLLIERIRTGLWLCLTSITLFGITDPFLHPQQLAPIYGIKALQIASIAFFFWACRQPLSRTWAIMLAQTIVFTMSVTTAWSGIITMDEVTTPLLLTVLTMGTATLLPWGVRPQLVTQALTALCVLWISEEVEGDRYAMYLPVIVVVSSSVSIYVAYALERHRVEEVRSHAALSEAQARQHQAEVATAARLNTLGGMAAGLAHELNQPLAAVVSYARGCARRLQAGDLSKEALLEVLEEISAQALRAGEVLRRIRDFLQGEARREWIDLNEVVRRALRFAEGEARRGGVQLDIVLAPGPLAIEVDPIEIEQVLLNLVQNGFEVMSANNGEARVLGIRTRRVGEDLVEVAVADTGPGLSADATRRLFDPFFTTKPDGLGLGLSISRTIVEAHGGRLWATPNPPRGTIFRFTLRTPAEQGATDT